MTENSAYKNSAQLDNTVIQGGYCIGCGNCAANTESQRKIYLDDFGRYIANSHKSEKDAEYLENELKICPFSDKSASEDQLADVFLPSDSNKDFGIGKYIGLYGGFVSEGEYRTNASSGGMVTWLLTELMNRNEIDAVAHVQAVNPSENENKLLFGYAISKTTEQIMQGAKSRYYPIELSGVYKYILENEGRYAIVGVPCFIKAVRLLMLSNPVLKERIRYCISLVCGHLKSTKFSELLALQMDNPEQPLKYIDFRQKQNTGYASNYAVKVQRVGTELFEQRLAKDLYGSDWGLGFFKYQACDFCDDVFGETADLTAGDAWYTKYANDPRGANVIVARNRKLNEIIQEGMLNGRLSMSIMTAEQINRTQRSGLKHRREGLSYRLYLADKLGIWRPRKRVNPKSFKFNKRFRTLHSTRMLIARESHFVFAEQTNGDKAKAFEMRMRPLVAYYKALYKDPDRGMKIISNIKAAIKPYIKQIIAIYKHA